MGANTTKPTFPSILVILKPQTRKNTDIDTSEIVGKKPNIQWHNSIACCNRALSVQECGPMEITVKSTQILEASSCWAGGQPFTHQSSLKFQFNSSRVFFSPPCITLYKSQTCVFSSDGTLNPNGVRFGSSEIYNIGEWGRGWRTVSCFFFFFFPRSKLFLL